MKKWRWKMQMRECSMIFPLLERAKHTKKLVYTIFPITGQDGIETSTKHNWVVYVCLYLCLFQDDLWLCKVKSTLQINSIKISDILNECEFSWNSCITIHSIGFFLSEKKISNLKIDKMLNDTIKEEATHWMVLWAIACDNTHTHTHMHTLFFACHLNNNQNMLHFFLMRWFVFFLQIFQPKDLKSINRGFVVESTFW